MSRFFKPSFPFEPKKFPFFYGWWILVVATFGMLASIPGQTIGVGVFTEHLLSLSNLSRLDLSIAYMLGTVGSSLLIPYGGKLLDLWGSRIMIIFAGLGLAFALFLLKNTEGLLAFLNQLSWLSPFFVSFVILSLIFLLLRQFGQGLMTMVSRFALSKWFDRRRGVVTGINGVFVSFGFSSAPLLLNTLILEQGYLESMVILAIICGLGTAFLGWLFFRDQPEDCGMEMDGAPPQQLGDIHSTLGSPQNTTAKDLPLEEVRRSFTFWIFTLGMASSSLIITGFTFHIASIGEIAGLDRSAIYSIFLPISIISVITNFTSGWLSDRIPLKYLLMVLVLSLGLGSFGMLYLHETIGRVLVMIGYGIQGGVWGCLSVVTWPRFYGRKHLGAISGLFMGVVIFASAIGPAFYGISQQITGSYNTSAWVAVLMNLLIFVGAFKAHKAISIK
ncbi:MAG: MFS transporter [Deltaproteobacteria bacterium]|nr:MFS transporter [Deltaproteobacteria bacterium]